MSKYVVVDTPWPNYLPNGTEVTPVEAPRKTFRAGSTRDEKVYTNDWYMRADGVKVGDRKDGKFRLFSNEVLHTSD